MRCRTLRTSSERGLRSGPRPGRAGYAAPHPSHCVEDPVLASKPSPQLGHTIGTARIRDPGGATFGVEGAAGAVGTDAERGVDDAVLVFLSSPPKIALPITTKNTSTPPTPRSTFQDDDDEVVGAGGPAEPPPQRRIVLGPVPAVEIPLPRRARRVGIPADRRRWWWCSHGRIVVCWPAIFINSPHPARCRSATWPPTAAGTPPCRRGRNAGDNPPLSFPRIRTPLDANTLVRSYFNRVEATSTS